tara:strand:- start:45 stop:221 length:177 start_codon:yes stop_codon:yes gene_type:complete
MAKKMTMLQYKKKYRSIIKNFQLMFNDKIEHSDSKGPMSAKKLLDVVIMLQGAERRIR